MSGDWGCVWCSSLKPIPIFRRQEKIEWAPKKAIQENTRSAIPVQSFNVLCQDLWHRLQCNWMNYRNRNWRWKRVCDGTLNRVAICSKPLQRKRWDGGVSQLSAMRTYQNTDDHAENAKHVNYCRKKKAEFGWILQTDFKGNNQPHAFEHVQAIAEKYCLKISTKNQGKSWFPGIKLLGNVFQFASGKFSGGERMICSPE